jgi:hypothetical protein
MAKKMLESLALHQRTAFHFLQTSPFYGQVSPTQWAASWENMGGTISKQ